MSVMLKALILCMIIVSVESAREAMTLSQANFFAVYNGEYDNKEQAEEKNSLYDFIQARSVPVKIDLFPRTVLFYEWSINGKVDFVVLVDTADHGDGSSVDIRLYYFKDISKIKPLEYDLADLDDLTIYDLINRTDCVGRYGTIGVGKITGICPDCTRYLNGKRPLFKETIDCTLYTGFFPDGAKERQDTAYPYIMHTSANKYPIPGAPPGYVNPCKASSKPYY